MAASAAAAAVAAADGRKAKPNAALGGVATRRSTRRENSLGGASAVENADADDAAAAIGEIDAGCDEDEDQHRLLERDGRSDTDRHTRLLWLLLLLRECAPTRLACREPPPPPLALLRPLLVRLDGLLRLRLRCGANGGSEGRCCCRRNIGIGNEKTTDKNQ